MTCFQYLRNSLCWIGPIAWDATPCSESCITVVFHLRKVCMCSAAGFWCHQGGHHDRLEHSFRLGWCGVFPLADSSQARGQVVPLEWSEEIGSSLLLWWQQNSILLQKKWPILNSFWTYDFLLYQCFMHMNSTLQTGSQHYSSRHLWQLWVWKNWFFWLHTGIYMEPELILQSSFKASSKKLAILAYDSSVPCGDVCIEWIVFMCLFLSIDCGGDLEWLTEMEMLRMLKAKLIMCVSYQPETSQMGVVGRLLSGRGISPSAEFCVWIMKDVAD